MANGPVHFILTQGDLTPQYRRGLESARVHGAPIWLHYTGDEPDVPEGVETFPLKIPSWLAGEHPAHICDPLLLEILYEYGGMFLGMDTISVAPALDLLTRELCVSLDVPWGDYTGTERHIDHPFSMHLIAQQESDLVHDLMVEARYRVENWKPSDKVWGYTGPAILTSLVLSNMEDRVDVPPFPTLCGFEGSTVWRWYLGVDTLPPEARVLHLFSSAYPELYQGRADLWLDAHPDFDWAREHVADWPYCRGALDGDNDHAPTVEVIEPDRVAAVERELPTLDAGSLGDVVLTDSAPQEKRRPALHVVSLPWTATTSEYLTCAYTQKVVKFCRMMEPREHEVILYASEENEAPCHEHVALFSEAERDGFFGEWGTEALFKRVTWDNRQKSWRLFNARAIAAITERAEPHDLVLLVGGNCQKPIADALSAEQLVVEPFVGYEGVFTHAAFESAIWRNHVYGLMGLRHGRAYDATIPNYFDPAEFFLDDVPQARDEDYLLFVGRLIERKGPHIAGQIAEALGMKLIVAGPGGIDHGDDFVQAEEVRVENRAGVEYVGEIGVEERCELMAGAAALMAPTLYVEPFGGVAVEAMMCATPVVASDWGSFAEIVTEGLTGYRFGTLRAGVEATQKAMLLDRWPIREHALGRFSLEAVAPLFERWFTELDSLWREGWSELPTELALAR